MKSSFSPDLVILVNESDHPVGSMKKMRAHQEGRLHRAISVFIFNAKGEMLLQQRAAKKYHSALLWSNACCSHPRPGESTLAAATRRLKEEMGIQTQLQEKFSFIYKAFFENGLTEHELDHVFTGVCDELPVLDKEEAAAFRYITVPALEDELRRQPETFTAWLKICLPEIRKIKSF